MVFRRLLSKAAPIARGIATTSAKRSGHDEARSIVGSQTTMFIPFSDEFPVIFRLNPLDEPLPFLQFLMQNVPFSMDNRYRLMLVYILYFSSGIGLPFISLRHMTLAKSAN